MGGWLVFIFSTVHMTRFLVVPIKESAPMVGTWIPQRWAWHETLDFNGLIHIGLEGYCSSLKRWFPEGTRRSSRLLISF